MTQATPSCVRPSQCLENHASSEVRVHHRVPLLRIEVGTLASGRTARMTGSASAMTSSGVR